MGKTKILQVINNRTQFRCSGCDSKRTIPVRPDLRRKSIKCHKCGETTYTVFNRRAKNRDSQCGKILLITQTGVQMDVHMHDISQNGIGFDIPFSASRSNCLSAGSIIKFHCSWNPRLIGGYFKIRNVHGQRVGAMKH